MPFGHCHHDVLHYSIYSNDINFPVATLPQYHLKHTSISWHKIDWELFNQTVEETIKQLKSTLPLPINDIQHFYQIANTLKTTFNLVSKTLPCSCCLDLKSYWTPKLHQLSQQIQLL